MPTSPRFDADTLALLDSVREVEIETAALDGAGSHRTVIWIVVDGDQAFVRSVRGSAGRWYREILRRPAATLHVTGQAITVTAVPAADPQSIERTSEAFRLKYGRRSRASTESMLQPHTLHTTLRLEPRER
jgi:hypothetical protein